MDNISCLATVKSVKWLVKFPNFVTPKYLQYLHFVQKIPNCRFIKLSVTAEGFYDLYSASRNFHVEQKVPFEVLDPVEALSKHDFFLLCSVAHEIIKFSKNFPLNNKYLFLGNDPIKATVQKFGDFSWVWFLSFLPAMGHQKSWIVEFFLGFIIFFKFFIKFILFLLLKSCSHKAIYLENNFLYHYNWWKNWKQ